MVTEIQDIRQKPDINHQDITALNFIRDRGGYRFRKHYREGLRSRIIEMLRTRDIEIEKCGILCDGIRLFPRAVPVKMLRIFTRRFDCLEAALLEAGKYKIIQTYLHPDLIAVSTEFIVEYAPAGRSHIVLCGLQEYVGGEILDPWGPMDKHYLRDIFTHMHGKLTSHRLGSLMGRVHKTADQLVRAVKKMIREAGHIPDLAGVGNLMINSAGAVKLVDINNISAVSSRTAVSTDDKGYPVCDKSIEALSLMETNLLHRTIDITKSPYHPFLSPERVRKVKFIEAAYQSSRVTNTDTY